MENQIQLDIKDVQMLLGEKDLVIYQLQKEIQRLQDLIKEQQELKRTHEFPKAAKES